MSKCGPGLPLGYGQTSVTVNALVLDEVTVAASVSVLTAVNSPSYPVSLAVKPAT